MAEHVDTQTSGHDVKKEQSTIRNQLPPFTNNLFNFNLSKIEYIKFESHIYQ
ncbi:hypothetical protein Pcaca04_10180 [Pectobacterium carotovorum subsp. carotovorum]|nr:hypothetical protein Pcaca04_10180 [Pectobacterium carotovorum subsp. carotovorum]